LELFLNISVFRQRSTVLILILACIIRLPISLISYRGVQTGETIYESWLVNNSDGRDYLRLAENLVENGNYSLDTEPPYEPNLKRVPGYPIFLVALYILAGGEHSPFLILVTNLIFSLLNIWLLIQVGRQLFSPTISALAGLIYALAPISIVLANQAMSESLFTFLVLLSLYFVVQWKPETWRQVIIGAIGLGILLALATYVRAIATYVLPIFWLYWIVRYFNLKKAAILVSLSFMVFVALLFPWYFRNYNAFGVYTFSSISDGNLLTYNAASVYAQEAGLDLRPAKDFMNASFEAYLQEHPEIDASNQAVLAAMQRQIAMEIILKNPIMSLLVHIKDSINTFRPGFSQMNLVFFDSNEAYGNNVGTGEAPKLNELSLMQIFIFGYSSIYYVLLYLGTGIGLLLLLWQKQWLKLLLLFVLPYWFALVPSIAGNSRFRVPIEGFMALLSAFAVFTLLLAFRKRFQSEEVLNSQHELSDFKII
jgi:4-amino-4-deoxy-L-arabinose transferase-like glycosyltransferase